MSLFRSKPREERAVSYQNVFGAGGDVSAFGSPTSKAVQLTSVQACWRLVAESVASLPIDVYRKDSSGISQPVTPEPALIASPSEVLARDEWVRAFVVSMMSDGNAFGVPRRLDSLSGRPTRLEWVPPEQVNVTGSFDVPVYQWGGITIPGMVHVRGITIPGEARGMSPLRAAMRTVESGIEAEKFGHDFFRDSRHPAAVLTTDQPVTEDQAAIIKARFMNRGSREPFVAGAGLQYKAMSVAPEESQFLQTQKFTVSQIARIYGVPPEMIGGESGGSLTYANVEQRAIDFAQYTLRPMVVRLERALTAMLPRPQYVKLNLDAMIRADTLSRYQAHEIALRAGFKNQNEVRGLEDLEPVDGGDQLNWPPYAVSAAPSPQGPQ